eukprot:gene4339-113_t
MEMQTARYIALPRTLAIQDSMLLRLAVTTLVMCVADVVAQRSTAALHVPGPGILLGAACGPHMRSQPADIGSAYGTAKAGVAVAHLGIRNSPRAMKGISKTPSPPPLDSPARVRVLCGMPGWLPMHVCSRHIRAQFPTAVLQSSVGTCGGITQCPVPPPFHLCATAVPVVMAGILGIYGLIVAVIIVIGLKQGE